MQSESCNTTQATIFVTSDRTGVRYLQKPTQSSAPSVM